MDSREAEIGIGPTRDLSLRVSVAVLVRVLFEHPQTGERMLALERRATAWTDHGRRVAALKSHPFGGAIRIQLLPPLQDAIGDFHFDSENSRLEQDFRLFIRPDAWENVQRFCLRHFGEAESRVLEADPCRELEEEFLETLQIELRREWFTYHFVGTILEQEPSPTENLRVPGHPTTRIYRLFEARLLNSGLISALLTQSKMYSDPDLKHLVLRTPLTKEVGMLNTVLTLPYETLVSFYSTLAAEQRATPISFQEHRLDETVAAVVGVDVPKYRRA